MQQNLTSPIRVARLKKGLSQADLGKQVGVTKASVSGWETGVSCPDIRNLARLVRALRPHLKVLDYVEHVEAAEQGKADAGQARAA